MPLFEDSLLALGKDWLIVKMSAQERSDFWWSRQGEESWVSHSAHQAWSDRVGVKVPGKEISHWQGLVILMFLGCASSTALEMGSSCSSHTPLAQEPGKESPSCH